LDFKPLFDIILDNIYENLRGYMSQEPKNDFVFRKHMSIGEVDAENDTKFLRDCFVDTGDYDVLDDTQSSQCIVLGRTGSGKSALLERLEKCQDQIIRIEPEELALKHISNSTILSFFEDLGVDLDIFYSLLGSVAKTDVLG
jgi:hypothetical protein